jgi:hypothetical protein
MYSFEYLHPQLCLGKIFAWGGSVHIGFCKECKEIHCVLGISHEDYDKQFMAILTVIEACHSQNGLTSNSKLVDRGTRELKRLACS